MAQFDHSKGALPSKAQLILSLPVRINAMHLELKAPHSITDSFGTAGLGVSVMPVSTVSGSAIYRKLHAHTTSLYFLFNSFSSQASSRVHRDFDKIEYYGVKYIPYHLCTHKVYKKYSFREEYAEIEWGGCIYMIMRWCSHWMTSSRCARLICASDRGSVFIAMSEVSEIPYAWSAWRRDV